MSTISNLGSQYNPDVLNTLSNLSNDEVFTPPELVNQMLDLLPQELWSDKNATFLDPATKSGVFLREIAKRLIKGLENDFPDLNERLEHIYNHQLYGIAITEITSLLARRSLYCSKFANSKYSIVKTKTIDGNIRFKKTNHSWIGEKCIHCGASKKEYERNPELESHAYEFIHTTKVEDIFNMKFDVIIGNPPYQLNTGGAQAQAIPLYHKFINQAKKLQPRYISMIVPSRWFTGGFGLNSFRDEMLGDNRIRVIHDFLDASECFPGVEIKGGVNYFLWDRDNLGHCKIVTHEGGSITSSSTRPLLEKSGNVFIRYNGAIEILKKIQEHNERSFSLNISSQRPFGIPTNFKEFSNQKNEKNNIKIYGNKWQGYISIDKITKNNELIAKWKVLAPKAIGSGDSKTDEIKPVIAEPYSVCTETYVVLAHFDTENEAINAVSYITTKFFHFLVTLIKNTQDSLARVYFYVPNQNFLESWDDEKLFKKYNLDQEEISFIDNMILRNGTFK